MHCVPSIRHLRNLIQRYSIRDKGGNLATLSSLSLSQKYVGAIDQGTSSTRFMIFDKQGKVITMKQKEHAQHFPAPGQVEHCPAEIWAHTQEVVQAGLEEAGVQASEMAALGITNQRETTVAWSSVTGEPYHNALVWNDTRTASICDELATGCTEGRGRDRFRDSTGLPLSPYFSGSKMMYLLNEVEGLREAGERGEALFGTMDSYLLWKLTQGSHATDVSNASRTLLMDLHTLDWDPDILAAMNIPRAMLPAIHPSSGVIARVHPSALSSLAGVPISGVLGDQQAALFGQACFNAGEVKATYGTGCFLLMNTGARSVPSSNGLLTTVAYQLQGAPPVYALEGSVAYSGSTIQWLRDNLQLVDHASECEELAAQVPDCGGVYFVPAFSGLFAPYWRSDARGVIAGLTAFNTKHHIVRAALEATAYQAYEVIEAMDKDCLALSNSESDDAGGLRARALKVDGGASQNNLLMQFQADLLNVPLMRPSVYETTAQGAAFAAGLGVGFWTDVAEVAALWKKEGSWEPDMELQQRELHLKGWRKAIQKSLGWVD